MPKMLTEESFELEILQSTDTDEDMLQLSVENFVMKRGRNDEIEVYDESSYTKGVFFRYRSLRNRMKRTYENVSENF